jgi:hypothetical protein
MTTYETRLRGARKRLREAFDLAPDAAAKENIEAAVKLINSAMLDEPAPQAEG